MPVPRAGQIWGVADQYILVVWTAGDRLQIERGADSIPNVEVLSIEAFRAELRAAQGTEERLEASYQREIDRSIELDAHRLKEEELLEEIRRLGL